MSKLKDEYEAVYHIDDILVNDCNTAQSVFLDDYSSELREENSVDGIIILRKNGKCILAPVNVMQDGLSMDDLYDELKRRGYYEITPINKKSLQELFNIAQNMEDLINEDPTFYDFDENDEFSLEEFEDHVGGLIKEGVYIDDISDKSRQKRIGTADIASQNDFIRCYISKIEKYKNRTESISELYSYIKELQGDRFEEDIFSIALHAYFMFHSIPKSDDENECIEVDSHYLQWQLEYQLINRFQIQHYTIALEYIFNHMNIELIDSSIDFEKKIEDILTKKIIGKIAL